MSVVKTLRIGSTGELPLQASKWLQLQLLVDASELEQLFDVLGDFSIFLVGCVCEAGQGSVAKQNFLDKYRLYIESLKSGQLPEEALFRSYFSSVFTKAADHLFQIALPGNREIIRVAKPVIQLQMNQMAYSAVEQKFRPVVFGKENFFWGIQFSYPQLYQDSVSKEIFQVRKSELFPNTALYQTLQQWVRRCTIPTPFQVQGKRINVPMRLGKNCLPWINRHCQLVDKGIEVALL